MPTDYKKINYLPLAGLTFKVSQGLNQASSLKEVLIELLEGFIRARIARSEGEESRDLAGLCLCCKLTSGISD